jgi:microcystin-dependent protein
MADPFVAEIRIFPFNFAPRGWAWCDGQLMPISQNTALFSLLGTTYGGDGKSTFALPDLQGRSPLQHGQGPGLSTRWLGENGGAAEVTLSADQMPGHAHGLQAGTSAASGSPEGGSLANVANGAAAYRMPGRATKLMAADSVATAGGGAPHNNRPPYLALYFCIAMQGVYPPRW